MLSDISTEDLVAELAERSAGLIIHMIPLDNIDTSWFGAKWEMETPHCALCFIESTAHRALAHLDYPDHVGETEKKVYGS